MTRNDKGKGKATSSSSWTTKDAKTLSDLKVLYEDKVKELKEAQSILFAEGERNKDDRSSTYQADLDRVRGIEAELDRLDDQIAEQDPVEKARRERRRMQKDRKEATKKERILAEAEEREKARKGRSDLSKQAVLIVRENVSELLDAANNAYQEYLCKSMGKEATLELFTSLRTKLKSVSQDRSFINGDAELSDFNGAVAGGFSALTALEQVVRADEPGMTNVEEWESLLPDTPEDPVVIPSRDLQKQLLGGVNLAFPFSDDKPSFRETASHPIMNASRLVGSTLLYMKAAKMARAVATNHFNPKKPPVVFDIGAGSFGAKRLQLLKTQPVNRQVAIHASIPIVQDADNARDSRARHNGSFVEWNYLPETKTPSLNRLNYCRHPAAECDCFKYYDERGRYALAIHSAYYFKQDDWRQIFRYTDQVECLMHIPKIGETMPLKDPEFEWVDVEEDPQTDLLARFGAFTKRLLTGDRTVKLKPLRHGETTYVHQDISQIVTRGGFHFTHSSAWIDSYSQGDARTAVAAACVATAGAVGGLVAAVGASGPITALSATVGAANALVASAAWVRFENWRARCARPVFATETVSCHVSASFAESNEEDIVTVQRFKIGPPRPLVPELVEAIHVDKRSVGRVAAALTLAKDLPNGIRQMAGSMLREDVPIKAVRDTLSHAQRVMNYVVPNGRRPPAGGRWLAWAVALPLCACSPLAALNWTLPAAYSPAALLSTVGAAWAVWKLLCIPTILALCLIGCMA